MRDHLLAWVNETIQKRTYRQYDDLHIDELDRDWAWDVKRSRDLRPFLALLLDVSNEIPADFRLTFAMSLVTSTAPAGINFRSHSELLAELDPTPPSFYLFERGTEPWKLEAHNATRLDPSKLWSDIQATQGYYIEYKEAEEVEFRRSLWLVCH